MKLYNSLTKKIEKIDPIKKGEISIYSCGPTVYWDMHVGNLRAYAEWDILHRALLYLGYDVNRVMNFTDVGHMTDDDDFGNDKIEESASSEGVDPLDISNRYIRSVLSDFSRMNFLAPSGEVLDPDIDFEELKKHNWVRATEYISEMIDFVKKIEKNGFAYETSQAIYFDVSKYDGYSKFFGQDLKEKKTGVRDEVSVDKDKRNSADFVLWMKRVGKYAKHSMYWDSPWGEGFPGWHIECSAMGCDLLGDQFDIHTGGVDHISIHHANERAQNYGAFGHEVVKYWVHNEFIRTPKGEKLSKSKGNAVTLDDVVKRGIDPMDLRYHYISVNYRTPLKFNWEVLEESKNSRLALIRKLSLLNAKTNSKGALIDAYVSEFKLCLEDNLNISKSLALVSELLKSDNKPEDIVRTVLDFDRVFGLKIEESLSNESEVPGEVKKLLDERQKARESGDFVKSDSLRDEISKLGFKVLDTSDGQKIEKS